jgi:hypothetical protein
MWRVPPLLLLLLASLSTALSLTSTAPARGDHWEIFRVIQVLERDGVASNRLAVPHQSCTNQYHNETMDVLAVLTRWSLDHVGDDNWRSLLNKSNLRHEVEESIVALHHLRRWTANRKTCEPFIAVDGCCGKALFSMLLSYLAADHADLSGLSRIILFDKDRNIDWRHVQSANHSRLATTSGSIMQRPRPILEVWAGINLHDYDSSILPKLQSCDQPIALTGIHLCKTLSPAFVGLGNQLGPNLAPYLCLAPCCLPRRTAVLNIDQYEAPMQRSVRLQMTNYRDLARERWHSKCYVCQENHHVANCPRRDHYVDDEAWNHAVASALLLRPCWKCGKTGHRRDECRQDDRNVELVPASVKQPMDLSMLRDTDLYESYCEILATFVQHTKQIEVVDSGLTSPHSNEKESNWNRHRKSIFIVASR